MKYIAAQLIAAIVSTLVYGLKAAPVGSLSRWDSPCLALDDEGPVNPRGVLNMTADLITRIDGVISLCRELKEYNAAEFNYANVIKQYLDLKNFIDTDKYTIKTDTISTAVANPAQAVQTHYALMYELVAHVEKSRTDGKIKEMTGEGTLRRRLHEIELKMYDIICSMRIALRGEGASTEHSVTEEVLSGEFLGLNDTLANETYRAYVEMNDSEGIMSYVKEILTSIQSSQNV